MTDLQLRVTTAGFGAFTFQSQGEFLPSVEPVYKEAADPPELSELRHTWEFRDMRIVAADAGATWDRFQQLLGLIEDRDDPITNVAVWRGTTTEEWDLGGSGYEQLRVELLEVTTDELVPDATWGCVLPVTLRVSAVRKFEDARGIVDFSQRVLVSYDAGLQTIEWQTRIVTASGTSAVGKAQTYAKIPITLLGSGFAYATNGPDGVDYEVLDADETDTDGVTTTARTPTIVQAVSRVREFNTAIGASGGGTAPDEVDYSVTTEITAEQTETTTEAWARGPNAQQWVLSKKPAGDLAVDLTVDRSSINEYRGTWVRRVARTQAEAGTEARTVKVEVTGGERAVKARPIPGGLPLIQYGAVTPWEASVSLEIRRTGGEGKLSELPLPAKLGDPWVLDGARSSEGLPMIEERAASPEQHKWLRAASLVYVAAAQPTGNPAADLATADNVDSYFLGA